jgi:hypothetical protein
VRSVQPSETLTELLWEQDHIAVIGLGYDGYPFDPLEIRGLGETHSYTMPRVSTIGDKKLFSDQADSRVFNAILLVLRKNPFCGWYHEGLCINTKLEAIGAAGEPKD